MHGETSILNQAVVADFISEGHFTRHLRRMRVLYQRKWQHFSDLLTYLPANCQVVANSAGMHLVLKIAGINDTDLQAYLLDHGFATSSLSEYFLLEEKDTGLVLGFANTNSEQRETITRLISEFVVENAN